MTRPRLAVVALAAASLAVVGCRGDTIRTTSDRSTTTLSPAQPGTTLPGGGGGRGGAAGTATSSAGAGAPTTAGDDDATVVLSGTDLGPTAMGAPADDAVAALTRVLGKPTRDLKQPGAECPGPERLVRWGRFSVQVSGGRLAGWTYDAEPPGPPALKTPSGVTIGTTVATLRRVYGDKVTFHPADEPVPASFEVPVASSRLSGTLTGTADDATTTSLTYGLGCGE